MRVESGLTKFFIACYQLWEWVKYETGGHPFLFLGTVIVLVLAWTLYKMEVRVK
jgi:hypothetical protein